jgi:NADH:ubiquinone oxidoreductase subunit 5 (subunit L)/multisubunit Na+/H+ antiporter MnhA subunit
MADQQDMRRLGGLINLLPFTYTIILIGSLSLMAIPFMTGFYRVQILHYILEYMFAFIHPNIRIQRINSMLTRRIYSSETICVIPTYKKYGKT